MIWLAVRRRNPVAFAFSVIRITDYLTSTSLASKYVLSVLCYLRYFRLPEYPSRELVSRTLSVRVPRRATE